MGLVVGDRRNRLQVLETRTYTKTFKTGSKRRIKEVYVLCDCGRTKWIRYQHVAGGVVKSCGCLNYEPQIVDPEIRATNRVHNYVRSTAAKRELDFKLSLDDVKALIFLPCFYCDKPPYRVMAEPTGRPYAQVNMPACHGLDRVDSSLGYTAANVVQCCFKCNMTKWTLNVEEMLEHATTLVARSAHIRTKLEERRGKS